LRSPEGDAEYGRERRDLFHRWIGYVPWRGSAETIFRGTAL